MPYGRINQPTNSCAMYAIKQQVSQSMDVHQLSAACKVKVAN